MQKFTRALTREIEIGSERLAVTLSEQGLSFRVVGKRRPPSDLSWAACLCAATGQPMAGPEPTEEEKAGAMKRLNSPAAKKASVQADSGSESDSEGGDDDDADDPHQSVGLGGLLVRLDKWVRAHRQRFHIGLLPGASNAQLDELKDAIPCVLPDDLKTVLSWHNGQNHNVLGGFEGDWMLLSTEEIAKAKQELDTAPPQGWNQAWLPFLEDNSKNVVVLDTSKHEHPLLGCWNGRADHEQIAPSLTAWFEELVTAFEQGQYVEDSERGGFHKKSS